MVKLKKYKVTIEFEVCEEDGRDPALKEGSWWHCKIGEEGSCRCSSLKTAVHTYLEEKMSCEELDFDLTELE